MKDNIIVRVSSEFNFILSPFDIFVFVMSACSITGKAGAWVKIFTKKDNSSTRVWHHGIITSLDKDGKILLIAHFCSDPSDPSGPILVRETCLKWFCVDGIEGQVVDERPCFSYSEVVRRAKGEVGKGDYNSVYRNCAHFTSWCYKDTSFSGQVLVKGFTFILGAASAGVIFVVTMAFYPWK